MLLNNLVARVVEVNLAVKFEYACWHWLTSLLCQHYVQCFLMPVMPKIVLACLIGTCLVQVTQEPCAIALQIATVLNIRLGLRLISWHNFRNNS